MKSMHLSSKKSLLFWKWIILDLPTRYLLGYSFKHINLFSFILLPRIYISLYKLSFIILSYKYQSHSLLIDFYHYFFYSLNMDMLTPYLSVAKQHLDWAIKQAELAFNQYIEYVDFTAFCFVYTIVLVWVLRKLNRPAIFRPKNKELIGLKDRINKGISTFIVNLPIIKQYVNNKFEKGLDDIEQDIIKDLEKDRDTIKSKRLPEEGMKQLNIQNRIQKRFGVQKEKMFSGKNSGSIYPENDEFCRQVSDFAAKYMYHNPLHLDTYKEVGKMEAQVIRMTCSLVTKNPAYGVVTSGGSESLIMSLYAYRKFYNKSKPNIVVPNSIHAAIDKGAFYFNIEVRKARLNELYEADVKHMASLIDSNTIALYASYANYPHGIIDPIPQVAQLAKKHKIGFHIDGCLGGFVAGFLKDHEGKFSLDIDGVTSISLDHHKFGLAPKGASCIIYKTKQMRQHMYYVNTDWVGSIYATPSFPGSRSGFASAGAWYSLTHVGRKQFVDNALKIVDATKTAAEQLSKIEGVKVIGKPQLCALAFLITNVDCFNVSSYLAKEKNWKISALHMPKGLHVSVTPSNCQNVKKNLASDVKEALEKLKGQPQTQTSTAAVYGVSASLPSQAMGDELLKKFMSITYK